MRKPKAYYVNVKNVKNKNFGYPGLSLKDNQICNVQNFKNLRKK